MKACGHCGEELENNRLTFHAHCREERNIPRRCGRCNKVKATARFSNDRTRPDGKFPWCMACQNDHTKSNAWQNADAPLTGKTCRLCGIPLRGRDNRRYCSNKCKDRVSSLRRLFSLTPEDYNRLVADNENGICPICQKRATRWNVDHDHSTGLVTGVVCIRCNIGLLAYSDHSVEQAKRLYEFLLNPPASRLGIQAVATKPPQKSQIHRMWRS